MDGNAAPRGRSLHRFANPGRFMRLSGTLLPWVAALGIGLTALGIVWGLVFAPRDYQQGDTVRIMYVHVPAAWMAMGGYLGLAIASFISLVWRHPLADVAATSIAVVGAVFTAICLATGSLWGKPMWGTWWVWDARLTSVLVLFFLYLGHIALTAAFDDTDVDLDGVARAKVGNVGAHLLLLNRLDQIHDEAPPRAHYSIAPRKTQSALQQSGSGSPGAEASRAGASGHAGDVAVGPELPERDRRYDGEHPACEPRPDQGEVRRNREGPAASGHVAARLRPRLAHQRLRPGGVGAPILDEAVVDAAQQPVALLVLEGRRHDTDRGAHDREVPQRGRQGRVAHRRHRQTGGHG